MFLPTEETWYFLLWINKRKGYRSVSSLPSLLLLLELCCQPERWGEVLQSDDTSLQNISMLFLPDEVWISALYSLKPEIFPLTFCGCFIENLTFCLIYIFTLYRTQKHKKKTSMHLSDKILLTRNYLMPPC